MLFEPRKAIISEVIHKKKKFKYLLENRGKKILEIKVS